MIKKIKSCRLCKKSDLRTIWRLNKSPIGDNYTKKKNKSHLYPLILMQCYNCKFVQLSHYIDEKIVYGEYLYVTKTSIGLKKHFEKNFDLNNSLCSQKNNILDIGSNDGSNLEIYKKNKYNVIGIEPAKKIAKLANNKGIKTYNYFFNKKSALKIKKKFNSFDLITVFNLAANIENFNDFIDNIKNLMHDKTILNIETFAWAGIVDKNLIDNIYHEHISYFHVKPLMNFFKKKGLEIIRAEYNNSKGSSLLLHVCKSGSYKVKKNFINKSIKYEEKLKLNSLNVAHKVIKKNEKIKLLINKLLDKNKKDNIIVGFGASCGTTTLLTYFEIYKYINFLVDDEKLRHNLYSPHYNIKISKPSNLQNKKVLILAWRYTQNIIKKHKNHLNKKNIIKILPKVG